ncbi:iron chaperone, partial [Aphanothece microscopica]|uniref:iron chaperone n=1 Tax=Aphanothece microscopica TaxID=1049561 RepID=UPI003CE5310F
VARTGRHRGVSVRATLLRCVPGATEAFRYGMPAVMIDARHGIHYAAWKKHIALYPVYRGDDAFEALVGPYRAKTDSVHFAHSEPLPIDVVEAIATALHSLR